MSKIVQSGGFLGTLLESLLKTGVLLSKLKNKKLKPLVKRVLIPLELAVAASVANAGIHKNILGLRKQNWSFQIKKMKDTM